VNNTDIKIEGIKKSNNANVINIYINNVNIVSVNIEITDTIKHVETYLHINGEDICAIIFEVDTDFDLTTYITRCAIILVVYNISVTADSINFKYIIETLEIKYKEMLEKEYIFYDVLKTENLVNSIIKEFTKLR